MQHLVNLTRALTIVSQQHLAYPVLHYFRSRRPEGSTPVAIAKLDDALLLIEVALDPRVQPQPGAVEPARLAIADYVDTVASSPAGGQAQDAPPVPSVAPLVAAGIPVRAGSEARKFETLPGVKAWSPWAGSTTTGCTGRPRSAA